MLDIKKLIKNKTNRVNFGGPLSKNLNKFNLKAFGGKKDLDFDGILNKFDCKPKNTMRQDYIPFKLASASKLPQVPRHKQHFQTRFEKNKAPKRKISKTKYTPPVSLIKEFSMNPTVKRGSLNIGRCGDAASCIVTDAVNSGVPMSDIEVFGVRAPNLNKGEDIYSNHMITKVQDKYYDPTKTQFGYKDNELITDSIDSRYNTPVIQPTSAYVKKGASLKKQDEWAYMTGAQKDIERAVYIDTDGDRVPDDYDCQINNTMRQDFTPFKWDVNKASKLSAAKRFGGKNLAKLQKIGSGRDRNVYAIDKDKVLKVAKNPGGLTQNTSESDLDWLTGQIKHYETGLDYVVMERAQPPGKATAKMMRHLKKARSDTNMMQSVHSQRADFFNSPHFEKSGLDASDFSSHDVNPMEFTARKQWGEKDGQPVLVDGGALMGGDDLSNHRIKDFKQNAWQLNEWQDTQNQRKEFKHKGNVKTHYPKSNPVENLSNFPLNNGASLAKQNEWKEMSGEQRDAQRQTSHDTDGDRVPDEYDCQPENTMHQDTNIYLSKRKDKTKHSMYTYSPTKNQIKKNTKNIFIGSEYKNVDFNKQQNINQLSAILGHEEQHSILDVEHNSDTSAKLDNIAIKTLFVDYDDETLLLNTSVQPKEIVGYANKNKHCDDSKNAFKFIFNKGASLQKQNEWKEMSGEQRNIVRQFKEDIDGDRVPDDYDCQPENTMHQDFSISPDQYDFDKKEFKFDNKRKVVMMPVEELYHKRGKYNLGGTTTMQDDYTKRKTVGKNITKAAGRPATYDEVTKHMIKNRNEDLKQQGYKPSPHKLNKDDSVTIKYRRSPQKYKYDMGIIMSPTNTDSERSGSLGDLKIAQGASRKEAGQAEVMFHANSMRDAVMKDSAEVPMITVHGSDFNPGATIGEGRHRIIAAKAAGLTEVPVFIEPNNRLPEGALDKYRELSTDEIQQFSSDHRVPGKTVNTNKPKNIEYKEYDKSSKFKPTKDFDVGYDEYVDKRTPEEKEEEDELRLANLTYEILGHY